jgi:outer membrane protein assembly factor BamB
MDSQGNVVTAGSTVNMVTGFDMTVAKLDGTSGQELWRTEITGDLDGPDRALSVAVDADKNVIAAGWITRVVTLADFFVVKLDGTNGDELWRREINGIGNGNDIANRVTVDAAGDVVVAGRTSNIGTIGDFTVVKFNGIDGSDF